jgi:hypothetical protein
MSQNTTIAILVITGVVAAMIVLVLQDWLNSYIVAANPFQNRLGAGVKTPTGAGA